MTPEALGLERLLGTMRRRCVTLQSVSVQCSDKEYRVSLEMDPRLEQTARALFLRVPEIRDVVEENAESFWAQFGMTGV
jgi:hypothetical protein